MGRKIISFILVFCMSCFMAYATPPSVSNGKWKKISNTIMPKVSTDNIAVGGSNNELRFYEGVNYVGFEAPALTADQIWILPNTGGNANEFIETDGSGVLSFSSIESADLANDIIKDNHIDWGVGADQVNSDDIPDHNGYTVKDTFEYILNRGKTSVITVSKTGGLGISWTTGEIYDQANNIFVSTTAGSGSLTDNAINYLKWISGTGLTISTTETAGDNINIATFSVYDGVINSFRETSLMNESIANTRRGLRSLFPTRIISGMSVSEDADVTNALDVVMDAGELWKEAIEKMTPVEIKSRTIALVRHFHTAGTLDYDTNAEIDTDNYDNPDKAGGQGLEAIPANKWVKAYFIYQAGKIGWVYPTAYYNTVAQAMDSALASMPTGLEPIPKLTAIVYQQGDVDFTNTTWIDVRAGISEESFNITTDHGSFVGLSDDDHPQYLLANGTRGLSANWDAGSWKIISETFESDIVTGTAPLIVASTTVVTNLNSDTIDGIHATTTATANNLLALDASKDLVLGTGDIEATEGRFIGNVKLSYTSPTFSLKNTAYDKTESELLAFVNYLDKDGYELAWFGLGSTGNNNLYMHNNVGGFGINVQNGASYVEAVNFLNTGVVFNESGIDMDFRIESNVDTHAFFVDGANGHIGLGCSPTYYTQLRAVTEYTNITGYGLSLEPSASVTANGNYYNIAMSGEIKKQIAAGITDGGYQMGLTFGVLRNNGVADAGTLGSIVGTRIQYGNYSTHANAITNNVYGLKLHSYYMTGTVGTLYDIYIDAGTAGGTLSGLHYGLYILGTTKYNYIAGGLVMGNPTGGLKGAGTINAKAVYDDNVLLTDYVFDKYYDDKIKDEDIEKGVDKDYIIPTRTEFIKHIKEKRHLPRLTGRLEWTEENRPSLGKFQSQLCEQMEHLAIYIKELHEENEELKIRIIKLEQRG